MVLSTLVADAFALPIAPPMLPVVSNTNMMSTSAVLVVFSTTTVLRIVVLSPTPKLAL
jgi:hypothetical protein